MTRAGSELYLVNRWVDAAAAGGLSIAVYLACLLLRGVDGAPAGLDVMATLSLFVALNFPHFSATNWRLYRSWSNARQFPVTSLGLPVLFVALVAAGLSHPGFVAPALVGLYYLWSPFHYSGQALGITLLYGRRSGFEIGRAERLGLATFVYAAFVNSFAALDRSDADLSFYGIEYPRFGLPAWIGPVTLALVAAGGAMFLGKVAQRALAARRLPPLALLMPALAHLVWFVVAKRTNTPLFLALVASFHSLQYLLVAWAVQIQERRAETGAPPTREFVLQQSLKWGAGNVGLGLLLFVALPWVLTRAVDTGLPTQVVFGIVWAALNVHHFFVDGVIWKLRRPGVAGALAASRAESGAAAPRSAALRPVAPAPVGALR